MAEIDRRRAISTVAGGPHIGQLADRYISPGRGSYRSVRDLNLESYCTVPEARIGLQLIGTWITRYRVVSAGGQDEEHDGEEDEATVLVGWRRHDEEGSWTWRDTKKHSVGQNAVGVIGIMAAVVWEVAVDSKGRDLGLGWIAASPSRSRQPVKSMVLGTLVYLVLVCSVHTVPITDRYVGMVGFTGSYNEYFGYATDMDAMVYLMLVNDMIHGLYPEAVAIGEDVSERQLIWLCRFLFMWLYKHLSFVKGGQVSARAATIVGFSGLGASLSFTHLRRYFHDLGLGYSMLNGEILSLSHGLPTESI
ncbi:hypothetical protein BHE74_00048399 [Ensete ventricosum]|nr:hypothetical protein BHE74_00048399 [Ensete ventricosum]